MTVSSPPLLRKTTPPRAQVRNLAALIKLRKAAKSPCVLMLGAGASMSSGVPSTPTLMRELLDLHGQDLTGDLNYRFHQLWQRTSPEDRRLFLTPYLSHTPSPGYEKLALAVQAGYFDLIVTFNFDGLVEKALRRIGFTDFKVIVRGETELAEIAKLVEEPVARLTILKLHGSLFAGDHFLFDYEEMANYPPDLQTLVSRITSRPMIICGYAFNDLCVIKAFSTVGEAVFCVNPSGAPNNGFRSILARRQSFDRVIEGETGKFDRFFTVLQEELFNPGDPGERGSERRAKWNPFKFLDSYDESDRNWFFGRREQTRELAAKFAGDPPSAIHLVGPDKAGKTSLVRAGLLAELDSNVFEKLYIRCRPDVERQLCDLSAQRVDRDPGTVTLNDALDLLAGVPPKRTVLVLDQFERAILPRVRDKQGWDQLLILFRRLCRHARPGLTLVFVAVEAEGLYYKLILQAGLGNEVQFEEVQPLLPNKVAAIIRLAAWKSGFRFDPQIINDLIEKLQDTSARFSLAHLQAICYLLVKNSCTEWHQYQWQINMDLRDALDSAINASDFLNYVEDLPLKEGRYLLRRIMKVVSEPGRQQIAALLKERFAEVLQVSPYPEPL